eukprot:UN12477
MSCSSYHSPIKEKSTKAYARVCSILSARSKFMRVQLKNLCAHTWKIYAPAHIIFVPAHVEFIRAQVLHFFVCTHNIYTHAHRKVGLN